MVVASAFAAVPAVADPEIEIDGYPAGSIQGAVPRVNIKFSSGGAFGGGQFTVTNLGPNFAGDITEVRGGAASGHVTDFQADGPPTAADGTTTEGPDGYCGAGEPQQPPPSVFFWCATADPTADSGDAGAIQQGESQTFSYKLSDPGSGLAWVQVFWDFSNVPEQCRPSGFSPLRVSATGLFGRTAVNCTWPTHTHIYKMKVNKKKHTAQFSYTAQHAKSYLCLLARNGRQMFKHSCGSTKKYTNRLPSGKYFFFVWGVNSVGKDPNSAFKAFTLK